MRDELEEVFVGALLHEGETGDEQRAGTPVLEAAAALVVQVQDEEVGLGVGKAAEDGCLGVRSSPDRQPPGAGRDRRAPHHELMLHPLGGEGVHLVRRFGPALEGAVGQLVVVAGAESPSSSGSATHVRQPGRSCRRTAQGSPSRPTTNMAAALGLRKAWVASTWLVRTVSSKQPSRYEMRTVRAPSQRTRQVCLSTFSSESSPPSPRADISSTWRSCSRTR